MVEQVLGVGGGQGSDDEGALFLLLAFWYLHSFDVPSFCSEPSREKQVKLPAHGRHGMGNGPASAR